MRDPFTLRLAPGEGAKFLAACERAAQREQAVQEKSVTLKGEPTGAEPKLDDQYPATVLAPWMPAVAITDGVEYGAPTRPEGVLRDEPGWRRIGSARHRT